MLEGNDTLTLWVVSGVHKGWPQILGVHPGSWKQAASGPFSHLPTLQPWPRVSQSCDWESQSPLPAPPAHLSFSHEVSHLQPAFCPPQFQSQFLMPLLLILASVLLPSHEAVSHKAAPLDLFPKLLVLPHMCFLPSQDDSLYSILSNHCHLISGFCLHFPAVLHPVPKHVQPQHLGAAIGGQVLLRACNLGAGACLVQTEPLEDIIAAKFLRSIYWTWAKAKHLAKFSLFSHSWHQGRSSSMPNVMSVLQGMDILELID